MGRPVKVEDPLYESLQQEASRHGITLQDALARRLTDSEAEAQRLSALCDELKAQLRAKESDLVAAQSEQEAGTARVSTLEAEIEEAREALSRAESKQADLELAMAEWQSHAEELDQTLEHERTERKRRERAYKGILFGVGVAILIGTAIALRKRRQKGSEQAEADQEDERDPGLPAFWAR